MDDFDQTNGNGAGLGENQTGDPMEVALPRGQRRYLSAQEILGAKDIEIVELYVPTWGGWIRLRPMRGDEWDAFENSLVQGKMNDRRMKLDNFHAKLVARCIVDGNGVRMFNQEHVERLGKKSVGSLKLVAEKCQEICGIKKEDVDELTDSLKNDPFAASDSN